MDEQSHSSINTPADIDNSLDERSRENTETNMNIALSNIDNKMGKLTDLLVRLLDQNESSVKPSQGERPTGRTQSNDSQIAPSQGERPTGRIWHHDFDVEPSHGERPTGSKRKVSDVSESENESDFDINSSRGKRSRGTRTSDDLSIYAEDSADEAADLRELASTSKNKNGETQPQGNSKFLEDLAKSLSDEDESTSSNVEPKLADIAMKRWRKKLNSEKLKSISDKYQRPANCTSMTGIKCNPEIWSQLSSTKKRTDLQLHNIQQIVLKSAVATLQTTNALATSKSDDDYSQLLSQSVDTVALLAHAHSQLSQVRRDQIKPILKQEYSTICSAEIQPDSKWLFGSDLAKALKDAKEASTISSSLRNYSNKANNYSSARSNKNMSSYKRPQKDFLWRSQQKPPPKRKKSWNKGKREDSK